MPSAATATSTSSKKDVEIDEGTAHGGMSAVINFTARKEQPVVFGGGVHAHDRPRPQQEPRCIAELSEPIGSGGGLAIG